MSTLRAEQSSRSWWTLSSKSSKPDLHRQYSAGGSSAPPSRTTSRTFPSLASVIGLKSGKKPPSLAISVPTSPVISSPIKRQPGTELPGQYFPGPSSRSVVPPEYVTPPRKGRHSLLSLSDDPFAVRTPTSSSAASASFPDAAPNQAQSPRHVHDSHSSSSSNSNPPPDFRDNKSRHLGLDSRTIVPFKSLNNLKKKPSQGDPDAVLSTGHHSQPNSRPPTRTRGMTESRTTQSPHLQEFHRDRQSPSPRQLPHSQGTSPHIPSLAPISVPSSRPSSGGSSANSVLKGSAPTRQTSYQRLQPPTAPPTHDLPQPPSKPVKEPLLERERNIPLYNGSLSSSSPSLVSSISSNKLQTDTYTLQDSEPDQWSFVTSLRPEPEPNVISRSSSSRSYAEKLFSARTPSEPSIANFTPSIQQASAPPESPGPPKSIRKQRSQHRLGMIAPIALGFRQSHTSFTNTSTSPEAPMADQRRTSTNSHTPIGLLSARRRVFSGGSTRRPSTATNTPISSREDDTRSMLSVRSDHEAFVKKSSFKPEHIAVPPLNSFWDDQAPSSPLSDYAPLRIMSPEAQAKVEAELDEVPFLSSLPPPVRDRSMSMVSNSTILSDRESEIVSSSFFPSLDARKSAISMTSLHEGRGLSRSHDGRAPSITPKAPPTPQIPRRPATSGSISHGFEITGQEKPKPRYVDPIDILPKGSTSPDTRRTSRKMSDASHADPESHLRSLPPPPRPRARAQVVTVTKSLSELYIHTRSEKDVRNTIGVDFGHGQRPAHSPNPSIQSTATGNTFRFPAPPSKDTRGSFVPPVPPRSSTRPPPKNYRSFRESAVSSTPPGNPPMRRIHKKPSFLEIDDDDEDDNDELKELDFATILRMNSVSTSGFSRSSRAMATESFLEFGRESFDTIGSADFRPTDF